VGEREGVCRTPSIYIYVCVCFYEICHVLFFFFFDMSTQGKGEGGLEFVTLASLSMVYSRLSYPLETFAMYLKSEKKKKKKKFVVIFFFYLNSKKQII
jgi:hypothetical protein